MCKAYSWELGVDRHVPGVALTVRIRNRSLVIKEFVLGLSWREIRTVLEKLAQVMQRGPAFLQRKPALEQLYAE